MTRDAVAFRRRLSGLRPRQGRRSVTAQTQPAAPCRRRPTSKLSLPPDSGPPPTIDADRAMQYVKEIVKLRPAAHRQRQSQEGRGLHHLAPQGRRGRRRRLHRRHARRQISRPQHHRQVSRDERRHHRHRQPLRHELSAAKHFLRRRQRRRLLQRAAAGNCQPAARQEARWLQRLAGVGRCGRGDETDVESDPDRQPLRHSSPGREVAGGRNAEEDQGVPAGRHDR